ncbi:NAD(P)-binding protein [Anoxybacillus sp. J5B_2022]|uniref:NAD(P)-binding protein n=1 Tax=Anoxybacillus sp. J5B_2022 TaxID=3003246 RepID=UPI0022857CF8|nr:NAD(P)-binding protein [Anoxybacillus sp. J5B_2022]MCZ0757149.1 NAD(P)-binding protein [Anoxybacillus sp. J5B_2022]
MSYPIMLDMTNKQAVVVGGGKVAERKIRGLKEANANVVVVAPEITEYIQQLADEGALVWRKKYFSPDDVEDAFLIIAATNNREVNKAVAQAAQPYQLINVVDTSAQSNFYVPSIVRRGKLTIAVSTEGASPTLAKKISREIAEMYDEDYGNYIDFLYECRQYILQNVGDSHKKQQLLQTITDEEFRKSANWEKEFQKLFEQVMGE